MTIYEHSSSIKSPKGDSVVQKRKAQNSHSLPTDNSRLVALVGVTVPRIARRSNATRIEVLYPLSPGGGLAMLDHAMLCRWQAWRKGFQCRAAFIACRLPPVFSRSSIGLTKHLWPGSDAACGHDYTVPRVDVCGILHCFGTTS